VATQVSYRFATFVFISNLGAKELNLIYASNPQLSYEAVRDRLRTYLVAVAQAAESQPFAPGQGFSLEALVKHHVLYFIPYFPLTRPNVRQCVHALVTSSLQQMVHLRHIASFHVSDHAIEYLTSKMEFDDDFGWSNTGCKTISNLIAQKVLPFFVFAS
jgi:hypothetical protein